MDKDNITKFPISYAERRKNTIGPLHVECEVSGRYLQFHGRSVVYGDKESIAVDVMTNDTLQGDRPRKLCELRVTREDLLMALENVSPKNENGDE